MKKIAAAILLLIFGAALGADWIAPEGYALQHRLEVDAPPSHQFPLGTDSLGRDRLARLLHGLRVSLLLAPAAALLATVLATASGGLAAMLGGVADRVVTTGMDLFLSLPWLFLLLMVRAVLPLNVTPWTSVAITFLLLGALGWAGPARIVRAGVQSALESDFLLQARAQGCSSIRLFLRQIVPNLVPLLAAQFWVAVPVFILSEANLGMLGFGVAEPLPSLGGLLRDMEALLTAPAHLWIAAPAFVLAAVVASLHILFPARSSPI